MLAADGSRHCRQPQSRKPRAVCGCVLAEPTQLSLALIGSSFGDPLRTPVDRGGPLPISGMLQQQGKEAQSRARPSIAADVRNHA